MRKGKFDHVLIGLVIAFIVSTLGTLLISGLATMLENSGIMDETTSSISGRRSRTTYLIGICLNIISINYFGRMRWFESQRGNLVGTFICAMIWLYVYKDYLFQL